MVHAGKQTVELFAEIGPLGIVARLLDGAVALMRIVEGPYRNFSPLT